MGVEKLTDRGKRQAIPKAVGHSQMGTNVESVLEFLRSLRIEMLDWAEVLAFDLQEMSEDISEYTDKLLSAMNLLEQAFCPAITESNTAYCAEVTTQLKVDLSHHSFPENAPDSECVHCGHTWEKTIREIIPCGLIE